MRPSRPALFVAGFSLAAASLQRVFAIVELFRAVAAFMIAPVFLHLAATVGGPAGSDGLTETGTELALWIGFGAGARRSGHRGRPLHPRPRASADAGYRALPGRRRSGLVLAAVAGPAP